MNEHSDVLARLATSRFRSRFRLGARERAYAEAKGRDTIEGHARDFIAQRLAPAIPRNDGRQTSMRGHPVFVGPARHRHLLSRMSGEVARHRARSRADGSEQERVAALIMAWIERETRSALGTG